MVRLTPTHAGDFSVSIPLAIGLFVSVSAIVALCAKHARKVSKKYSPTEPTQKESNESNELKFPPKSPLRSTKQLVATISNKALPFIHHHRRAAEDEGMKMEEGFGEGGLWQKAILMGEKCQPPEFSGVIYYDYCGNQISELPPRSPRASPLPSFSFPMAKDADQSKN
ncbi:hypothetical protein NMG60_11009490 [Bertholletia excelsa]